MVLKTTQFITLFLLLLVTGLFWGTWFSISRSIGEFSPAEFIHIGKVIIANVAIPMKIIFPSCLVCMALVLWFQPRGSAAFYLSSTALLLLVAALLITLVVEVPYDNQIKTWTPGAMPAGWEDIRVRWEDFHTARTFISLGSFAFFSASMLLQAKNKAA